MKAANISCVLRSARSRMEVCGASQMGLYELIAFNVAAFELKDEVLRNVANIIGATMKSNKSLHIKGTELVITATKKAHKHFDSIDPKSDFEIRELDSPFETQESLPPEVLAFADEDWLKKQIEGITKNEK